MTATPAQGRVRAVAAASIGNALEWYDFTIYALFAIQIGNAFFPDADATTALVNAFLGFGVGFVARPIGAIVIGAYADRHGRKAALSATILLMALGTFVIAVAPNHATIGAAAAVVILAGRMLQGLSAGGEIGGAAAFLVEQAPPNERARYAAWLQASMAISNVIGATVAFGVNALLDAQQVASWGWRVPFALGLLIAPIGLWLRRSLDETPEFSAARATGGSAHTAPLRQVFGLHAGALLRGFAVSVLWAISVYALVIFMPIHAQRAFGIAPRAAFASSVVANIVFGIACIGFGRVADRVGHRQLMGASAAAMIVTVPLLMSALAAAPGAALLMGVQCLFCMLVAAYAAPAPAVLSALFPVGVRATGMSLSYNAAVTIFGGFAPAILTWLGAHGGGTLAPAWYVVAAAIVAIVGVAGLPEDRSGVRER